MIEPLQAPTAVTPPVSVSDTSATSVSTDIGALPGVQKSAAAQSGDASTQAAQAPGSSSASDAQSSSAQSSSAQSSSDVGQPLRLLIEHDNATNHYVYKLYDSSGRIVREIPQESLAEAEKQASGAPGSLFDTTV